MRSKPTLEEVKEHFKDAETVESSCDETVAYFDNLDERGIHEWRGDFYARDKKKGNILLWNNFKKSYAKIITYKTPKFEITKETILKYQMKDEFPEVFEKKLVVGKWYKRNDEGLFCYGTNYGFWKDKWRDNLRTTGYPPNNLTEATPQEVETALKNECEKKLGLVDGAYIKSADGTFGVMKCGIWVYCPMLNKLYYAGYVIFDNGVFAKPIETITIQEAEKLLNKKIV